MDESFKDVDDWQKTMDKDCLIKSLDSSVLLADIILLTHRHRHDSTDKYKCQSDSKSERLTFHTCNIKMLAF